MTRNRLIEAASRYPQPYEEQEFKSLHKISIFDPRYSEYSRSPAEGLTRQNTRLADYSQGDDINAYLGVTELQKTLSKYPIENVDDYIARHNSGFVAYQDSRDGKAATKVSPEDVRAKVGYARDSQYKYVLESVSPGALSLDDGTQITVSKQDSSLLNQMLKDLNTANRKKMEKVMMKDKNGYEEILGFAKEAL